MRRRRVVVVVVRKMRRRRRRRKMLAFRGEQTAGWILHEGEWMVLEQFMMLMTDGLMTGRRMMTLHDDVA
eukprot:837187-Rhodomonas_salina.1